MKRSLFAWVGGGAAAVIVLASILVRTSSPGDTAADVGRQRADVKRFHGHVIAGRWDDVFRETTEPPSRDAEEFARLMREQTKQHGTITAITIDGLRLLRSRATPMLEVRETLTLTKNGRTKREQTLSYFALQDDRWLFAFSAPDDS